MPSKAAHRGDKSTCRPPTDCTRRARRPAQGPSAACPRRDACWSNACASSPSGSISSSGLCPCLPSQASLPSAFATSGGGGEQGEEQQEGRHRGSAGGDDTITRCFERPPARSEWERGIRIPQSVNIYVATGTVPWYSLVALGSSCPGLFLPRDLPAPGSSFEARVG